MTGTVNISRAIFEHGMFKNEPLTEREAWVWLIMQARWKACSYRAGDYVVSLARGQLAASVRFMAGAWQWTAARVQRFIERLKKMEMIRTKTDTGVSIITICNYDKFQNGAEASDTGPIQDRYRTDTEKKKDVRKKEDTEAIASDASVDFAKAIFENGVRFLMDHGSKPAAARSVVGKWRKTADDRDIFDAFAAAKREGVVDPVPWITARLAPKPTVDMDALWKAVAEGTARQ
jgi:hypothetical protein